MPLLLEASTENGWLGTDFCTVFSSQSDGAESCATFFCSRFNHPSIFVPSPPTPDLSCGGEVVAVSAVASSLQNWESTRHVFLVNFSHMILDSKNNQNCPEELQHFQTYCICMYLLHDIIAVHSGGHIHIVLTINQVKVLWPEDEPWRAGRFPVSVSLEHQTGSDATGFKGKMEKTAGGRGDSILGNFCNSCCSRYSLGHFAIHHHGCAASLAPDVMLASA